MSNPRTGSIRLPVGAGRARLRDGVRGLSASLGLAIVRTPELTVGMIGVIASALFSWVPSLWYDESATVTSARRTWAQLWAEVHNVDAVHGLYYALMHVWFDLVGYSPFTLRFPSALAIGVAAGLLVALGRRLGGVRLGIVAGLVFVLLPRVSWAGSEGRPYATITALSVGLTVLGLHATLRSRRRGARAWGWWAGYGALAAFSVTFNVYLALMVVAHGVTIGWTALAERTARRRELVSARSGPTAPALVTRHAIVGWAVASAAAGAVVAPVALEVMGQSKQVHWIGGVSWNTALQVFRSAWFGEWIPVATVGWALIIAGAATALIAPRFRPSPRSALRAQAVRIALPAALVPSALLIAATAAGEHLYSPKYASLSLPAAALLIALALTAIRPRGIRIVAIALMLALCVPTAVDARTPHAKQNTYWADAAAIVAEQRALRPSADEGVVYGAVSGHPGTTTQVIADSYPSAFAGLTDLATVTTGASKGALWSINGDPATTIPQRVGDMDTVWFVGSTIKPRDIQPETASALEAKGFHAVDTWTSGSVLITEYRR